MTRYSLTYDGPFKLSYEKAYQLATERSLHDIKLYVYANTLEYHFYVHAELVKHSFDIRISIWNSIYRSKDHFIDECVMQKDDDVLIEMEQDEDDITHVAMTCKVVK